MIAEALTTVDWKQLVSEARSHDDFMCINVLLVDVCSISLQLAADELI
jgi:hypothetical protein